MPEIEICSGPPSHGPPDKPQVATPANVNTNGGPTSPVPQTPRSADDPSRVWTPVVVRCIASFLPPNEVACSLRLVDSATAAQFAAPAHATVTLSQPVPHHAFTHKFCGPGGLRGLGRVQRLQLLHLTAHSGNLPNLLSLLSLLPEGVGRPSVFYHAVAGGQLHVCKELTVRNGGARFCTGPSPLLAAAATGSRELVDWLLERGYTGELDGAAGAAARAGHLELVEHLLAQPTVSESSPEQPVFPMV